LEKAGKGQTRVTEALQHPLKETNSPLDPKLLPWARGGKQRRGQRWRTNHLLEEVSPDSRLPLNLHHESSGKHLTGDRLPPRTSIRSPSLQRKGKTALLAEMPGSSFLLGQVSCHQSPTSKEKKRWAHQIRPIGSGDLLPDATGATPTRKHLPKTTMYSGGWHPSLSLRHLARALATREAESGGRRWTLKSGGEEGIRWEPCSGCPVYN
jgi:hypothetical protein